MLRIASRLRSGFRPKLPPAFVTDPAPTSLGTMGPVVMASTAASVNPKIAVFGAGNMGTAMLKGWARVGITATVYNRTPTRFDKLDAEYIPYSKADFAEACLTNDRIFLATKPWVIKEQCEDFAAIMKAAAFLLKPEHAHITSLIINQPDELDERAIPKKIVDTLKKFPDIARLIKEKNLQPRDVDPSQKTLISLAAGIPTESIRHYSGCNKVVRAMTNLNVAIGKGITGIYFSEGISLKERAEIEKLFDPLGKDNKFLVKNEHSLNLITGVFGSGPGWVCWYLENAPHRLDVAKITETITLAAAKLNILEDFPLEKVQMSIPQMIADTKALLVSNKLTPKQLREKVTTQRGTTAAAVEALEMDPKEDRLMPALLAATARAKQMGEEFAPLPAFSFSLEGPPKFLSGKPTVAATSVIPAATFGKMGVFVRGEATASSSATTTTETSSADADSKAEKMELKV